MQNAFQNDRSAPFLYYVFNFLYVNRYDTRDAVIEDQKEGAQRNPLSKFRRIHLSSATI